MSVTLSTSRRGSALLIVPGTAVAAAVWHHVLTMAMVPRLRDRTYEVDGTGVRNVDTGHQRIVVDRHSGYVPIDGKGAGEICSP